MNRRRFLAIGGGVIGSIAGCSGQSGSTTETDEPTLESGSATETPPATSQLSEVTQTSTKAPAEPVWKPREQPDQVSITDVLGSTHVNGKYHFTDEDYLNEGAKRIKELGSDVIKVWFHRPYHKYPFNSEWKRSYDSMVEVAKTQYFRELFDRNFSTYVLLAQAYVGDPRGAVGHYRYRNPDALDEEFRDRFKAVTRYLLTEYDGTGKTFVLQHWEGDNLVAGDKRDPIREESIDRAKRWLTARQKGVERARNTVESDVTVLHATEVNFVLDAMRKGTARLINEVVPTLDVDLVSYSAWEIGGELVGNDWYPTVDLEPSLDQAESIITDTLDYISGKAPDPNDYVKGSLTDQQSNVYLGEFGYPLNEADSKELAVDAIKAITEVSLDWGVRWALFWQLYDNEARTEGEVTENEDVDGHYLIRPDGTRASTWDILATVLEQDRTF